MIKILNNQMTKKFLKQINEIIIATGLGEASTYEVSELTDDEYIVIADIHEENIMSFVALCITDDEMEVETLAAVEQNIGLKIFKYIKMIKKIAKDKDISVISSYARETTSYPLMLKFAQKNDYKLTTDDDIGFVDKNAEGNYIPISSFTEEELEKINKGDIYRYVNIFLKE